MPALRSEILAFLDKYEPQGDIFSSRSASTQATPPGKTARPSDVDGAFLQSYGTEHFKGLREQEHKVQISNLLAA